MAVRAGRNAINKLKEIRYTDGDDLVAMGQQIEYLHPGTLAKPETAGIHSTLYKYPVPSQLAPWFPPARGHPPPHSGHPSSNLSLFPASPSSTPNRCAKWSVGAKTVFLSRPPSDIYRSSSLPPVSPSSTPNRCAKWLVGVSTSPAVCRPRRQTPALPVVAGGRVPDCPQVGRPIRVVPWTVRS
jgi:hypothetical protein